MYAKQPLSIVVSCVIAGLLEVFFFFHPRVELLTSFGPKIIVTLSQLLIIMDMKSCIFHSPEGNLRKLNYKV